MRGSIALKEMGIDLAWSCLDVSNFRCKTLDYASDLGATVETFYSDSLPYSMYCVPISIARKEMRIDLD
jgi:hypothetical protein